MNSAGADQVAIATALAHWRQGDACLQAGLIFVYLAKPLPGDLSPAEVKIGADEPDAIAAGVAGLVVISQTCDIVRDHTERPYVEVSPLIPVSAEEYSEVAAGRRPAYAALPGLTEHLLVADLSRSMTIEKSLLSKWLRTKGWETDDQIRSFADALARRRNRFAFPDDFVYEYVPELHSRIFSKHNRSSDEGRFLRSLREVRVRATPSWNSPKVDIEWFFIKHSEPENLDDDKKGWKDWVEEWLGKLKKHRKYRTTYHLVCRLEDISARDLVESDRLDFDRLS